jgi:hypothetical protein
MVSSQLEEFCTELDQQPLSSLHVISLSHIDPRDYEIPFVRPDQTIHFTPKTLGFEPCHPAPQPGFPCLLF